MFYVINIALFVICAMFLTVLVFLLFRAERRLAKYGESILFKSVKKELIKEEVSEEERNDEKEETFYKGYDTYLLASPRYYQFYSGYIRPRTAMYRGWVEGFHNVEYGVIPTLFLQKVGAGIISTIFNKPMVLNPKDELASSVTQQQYKKSNFNSAVKEAYGFAIDGGTALLKWNRDGRNQLRAEALPMDKFFLTVDSYGDIEAVKSFIATYHDTISASTEFYLCEERFFKYAVIGGKTERFPMVHYLFYKTSTNVTNENTPQPSSAIKWGDIPYEIRKMIQRDYGDIMIDYVRLKELTEMWKEYTIATLPDGVTSICTINGVVVAQGDAEPELARGQAYVVRVIGSLVQLCTKGYVLNDGWVIGSLTFFKA